MRWVVVGAGAIGGTLAGRLVHHGFDVLLVARGAHHDALRDNGLRLATPDGELRLDVPVAQGPAGVRLRGGDVLVLTVKSQDTAYALEQWAPVTVAGGGTAATRVPVVCAQNGVDNERQALRRFAHVLGALVWLPATYLEPGLVVAEGAPLTGHVDFGRYPEGDSDVARGLARELSSAGFASHAVGEIMPWKYGKLVENSLRNGLVAATTDKEAIARLFELVKAEAMSVLAAAGIAPVPKSQQAEHRGDQVQRVPVPDGTLGGSSMWQSLARGKTSTEVDYFNGEIVLLGRLHGVPTPANLAVQELVTRMAREGAGAAVLSGEELLREVTGS